MTSTLFGFIFGSIFGSIVLLCGNPLPAVAATPSSVTQAVPASRPDREQNAPIPYFPSRVMLTDQQQQLVAQLPQREQDSTSRGHSDKELSHELNTTRNSLQQAKQRIDELERQLAEGNLENAKRRIGELVIQLHAKDSELAALRSSVHENSKKLREDLAAQTEELAQAKRRISEVEQQMATTGKTQDLAQAKRRAADLEQQLTKKEQDLAQAKRRVTETEQQMAGKEQDLAQVKRRVVELEQQITGKEYESTQAKRRATEFEQQLIGKEQDLTQAKRRTTEAEQQTASKDQELTQTKRRIADLEQQLAAKEQESAQAKRRAAEAEQQTAGKSQDPAQAKRRVADLEQLLAGKEFESAQAKRRASELEQQTAMKEQELTQTKRRIAELEQQTAGKEQDPGQIKRRVAELEQQMLGKEQELGQIRDNLKQVTQKYADLGPMLMDRDAEIARTKRLLEDLERSLPKPEEALPSLEVSPTAKNMAGELPPDANLSVSDLPIPNTSGDGTDIGSIDLTKIGEALSGTLGEELKRGTVALRQERAALTLALTSSELFPPGEAVITPGGSSLIGQIGAVLQKFRYRNIEVTAHTDTKPIRNDSRKLFRDNLELSRARVEQASQALIDSGVDAARVKAVVYTTTKPMDTDESRNRNRRIEIVVSSSLAGHSPQGKLQPGKKPPQSISLSSPRRP
ncbi:MAG: OmpA family protein [Nitrospira sp.]|nr:OmpA family protein [Nitrospira sp.]